MVNLAGECVSVRVCVCVCVNVYMCVCGTRRQSRGLSGGLSGRAGGAG